MPEQQKKENYRYNNYTKRSLNLRAADFYKGMRKPEKEWKELNDLAAPLSEFRHLVRAEAYDRAFELIEELEPYLWTWGYYGKLAIMRRQLLGKLDHHKRLINKGNLGKTYVFLGPAGDTLKLLENARAGLEKKKDPIYEGRFTGWLGLAKLLFMSRLYEGFDLCDRARAIARENDDRVYEAWWLFSKGWISLDFKGNYTSAVEFCEKSSKIFDDLYMAGQLNIWGRASKELNSANLGQAYNTLGYDKKALKIFKGVIRKAKEIGDHMTVLVTLGFCGDAHRSQFHTECARQYYQKAFDHAEKAGVQRYMAHNLGRMGNLQRDRAFYLHISGKPKESMEFLGRALEFYQRAIDMEAAIGNDPEIRVLYGRLGNVRGILDGKDGEMIFEPAGVFLKKALEKAGTDENAKGHILLDLGRNRLRAGDYKKAQTYFEDAHNIHIHLAAFALGTLLLENPGIGTTYKTAADAFEKSLEVCDNHIRELNKIEIKRKAELQYMQTASLVGLAAAGENREKTHKENAEKKLKDTFHLFKSPDLLRDLYRGLNQIRLTSGPGQLTEYFIDALRSEILRSLAAAS